MSKEYIRQVERALPLPRKKRKEVVRDLQEAFESGAEHGESPEQVIRRLGTPQELAREIQRAEEESGSVRCSGRGRRLGLAVLLAVWAAAVFCIAASLALSRLTVPGGASGAVIGQANAMTAIQVESAFPLNVSQLLLAAGLAIGAAAIVLTVIRCFRRRKAARKEKGTL